MPDWKILNLLFRENPSPEFHLALEELLLERNSEEKLLLIYENPISVIMGKNQNPWVELNLPFCEKNSISVYRRSSGGGTVFHGEGNLLFCFIEPGKNRKLIPMKSYNNWIIKVLNKMGFEVEQDERACLLTNSKKISGNAQQIKKGNCLSHGTLLVGADLKALKGALSSPTQGIESNAVNSVKSEVGNLLSLSTKEQINKFYSDFIGILKKELGANEVQVEDLGLNQKSIEERICKHLGWDWVYGKTPRFKQDLVDLEAGFSDGKIEIQNGRLVKLLKGTKEIEIENGPSYRSRDFFDYLESMTH